MASCVWCLRVGQPMTREHVFARWLVRQVHGARALVPAGPPADTPPTRIARVTADVCAECNAGWMSTLEVSFRSALFARARVGVLQPQDRTMLSRWFTKTAVLLAHAHGGSLFDATHRRQIVAGMPDDVEVFVARRRRPPQPLGFAIDATAGAMQVRSVAVQVDDIVGHVAARGSLSSAHGTRLWPLRTHTLRWETLPVITTRRGVS
jgi:hypothetical protein